MGTSHKRWRDLLVTDPEDLVAIIRCKIDPACSERGRKFYLPLSAEPHTRKRVCLVPQIEGAKWNRKLTKGPSSFDGGLKVKERNTGENYSRLSN